jgi:hypothetical protein
MRCYWGCLTKLTKNKNKLRSDQVTGVFFGLPKLHDEGKERRFFLYSYLLAGPPVGSGNIRIVNSSIVKREDNVTDVNCVFETENSGYQLEVLLLHPRDEDLETLAAAYHFFLGERGNE